MTVVFDNETQVWRYSDFDFDDDPWHTYHKDDKGDWHQVLKKVINHMKDQDTGVIWERIEQKDGIDWFAAHVLDQDADSITDPTIRANFAVASELQNRETTKEKRRQERLRESLVGEAGAGSMLGPQDK